MQKPVSFLIAITLAGLSGCNPPPSSAPPSEVEVSDQESVQTEQPASASEADVPLTLASIDEISKLVAEAGTPVVVDIWSTACVPCMQEFHGLVELHKNHREKLKCVSINIDYIGVKSKPAETYVDDVQKFLNGQGSSLANYLSTDPDGDVYDKLDFESIPAVFVYNADGSIAKKFVDTGEGNAFTYEKDVTPFVDDMLSNAN